MLVRSLHCLTGGTSKVSPKQSFGYVLLSLESHTSGKLDCWLSEQPRDLGNMRFVFDGIENCEESIRICVVNWKYVDGFGTALMDGPSLNNESLENVRWFCRKHPDYIESGTDWSNVGEKEKMTTIYPWS